MFFSIFILSVATISVYTCIKMMCKEFRNSKKVELALPHFVRPEEIAATAVFLASYLMEMHIPIKLGIK
ncbi:hypothetical protein OSO01_46160 [Oceanobacillus sojae]|uniref:Uncharacterized protein n=1 Tax=Oceanobacillus sojae TaxID=582851 RepID=A0A511ZR28_9BACI|nr:hypothetical protein OSO01_46160 [Oceanobacillus sojae]